jgi:glutathione-regulated potassium-efflux system ancillary protein KefG
VDGNALEGKYWRSVVTTGEPESAFRHQGLNRYSLNDIMRPFELTAQMCRMHWMPPMIVYWARRQSPELMKNYARAYGDWLAAPLPNGGV